MLHHACPTCQSNCVFSRTPAQVVTLRIERPERLEYSSREHLSPSTLFVRGVSSRQRCDILSDRLTRRNWRLLHISTGSANNTDVDRRALLRLELRNKPKGGRDLSAPRALLSKQWLAPYAELSPACNGGGATGKLLLIPTRGLRTAALAFPLVYLRHNIGCFACLYHVRSLVMSRWRDVGRCRAV